MVIANRFVLLSSALAAILFVISKNVSSRWGLLGTIVFMGVTLAPIIWAVFGGII